MRIEFEKMRFKNIGSYGDEFQTIEFKNGIHTILAPNGSGKSTIINALNFVLFGKPYTKIKLSSLINKYNKRDMLVEIHFRIGKDKYMISRGLKPNVFDVYKNNNLLPKPASSKSMQEVVENILGMNETMFKQLIALGANIDSVKNFMDLKKAEKDALMEKLLDLEIFSELQQVIDEDRLQLQKQIEQEESELKAIQGKIETLKKSIIDIKKQNEQIQNSNQKEIEKIEKDVKELQNQLKSIEIKEIELKDEKLVELQNKANEIKTKLYKLKVHKESISSKDKVICPKCGEEFIPGIEDAEEKLIKIDKKIDKLQKELKNIEDEIKQEEQIIKQVKAEIKENNAKIQERNSIQNRIEHLESMKRKLQNMKIIDLTEQANRLRELKTEFDKKNEIIQELKNEYEDVLKIKKLLSVENIKGFILKRKIPLLNKYINYYLEKFETGIIFELNFDLSERIIRRDEEFEYNSLSNGEKQRIILSILFAFLRLYEENTSINILFLDEFLDSSLDEAGSEFVVNIIKDEFKNKAIFIITHKHELKEVSDSIYRIEKDSRNKFSYLFKEE